MNPLVANTLEVLAWAIPVVFAITVHEAAHAFAAWRVGDSTARDAGRLTLNPLPHVSPVGTVLVPAVAIFMSGIAFGWARPVPVNLGGLQRPRRAMILVALAGPASNLLMLLGWSALLLSVSTRAVASPLLGALTIASHVGVIANLALMVFNLLPVPPLDGGRVVMALLPSRWLRSLWRWHNVAGFVVVLLLVFSGFAGKLLVAAATQWTALLGALIGAG